MQENIGQENGLSKDLQAWLDKGSLQVLCGHSLFCIDTGESELPVLLMIHGFPTSSWDWQPMWSLLEKHYRLICLDMLGFGFSDKPDTMTYSIHGQADLFEALVTKLGLSSYHVLAHDYGDSVAQELLARQIDGSGKGEWLSCTLLNGGLFPETHHALIVQKLLLSPIGKLINKLGKFKHFRSSFKAAIGPNTQLTDKQLGEFWQLINYNKGRHLFHNLITYISDRQKHRTRWVTALQQSPVPVALINGSFDPISGAHLVVRYKELDCRLDYLAEYEEIGHYPHIEAPQRTVSSILEFLSQID